jgi:hypothetical protein
MSFDPSGAGPQQPYYTHGYPPQYDRVRVGSTRSASWVALAFGVVGVLSNTLASVEWAAVICGLLAIIAGLVGQRRPAARDKYMSWAGLGLGVVTLAISLFT